MKVSFAVIAADVARLTARGMTAGGQPWRR